MNQSLGEWIMASKPRVVGGFLLCVVLPTVVLITLIFSQVRVSLERQSAYRNGVAARLAAQAVEEHLAGLQSYVESFAKRPTMIRSLKDGELPAVRVQLQEMVANNPELDRAFVADADGTLYVDWPHDPSVDEKNFSYRDWYQGVSLTQRTYISEIYQRDSIPRPYLVAVAAPLRDERGESIGYLVAQHPIGNLVAWFARIRPSEIDSISIVLVDQHGNIATVQSTDRDMPPRLAGHPLAGRIWSTAEGTLNAPHPTTGEPSLISYLPIGRTGWKVLACQPRSAVIAPITELRRIILVLAGIFILGIFLTGFVWMSLVQSHHAQRRQAEEDMRRARDTLLSANQSLRKEIEERARTERELRNTHEELRKTHEELKAAQLSLVQAAKMESVGRLAAGVAHEVKNPLAVMLQGLEYLEGHLPAPARDETVTRVLHDGRDAVHRADKVIRGLLDFSATRDLEAGEQDVNRVLEEAVLLVKHELDRNQIHVLKELGEGLPRLTLDRQKMEQVFVNLMMNAIQAMPKGGLLRIHTSARRLDGDSAEVLRYPSDRFHPGDKVVEVDIDDTGPGIPEEALPKIFDPFFTSKPTGKGTGLGLTVSKSIVDLHGGTISIHNRQEGGVRVTLLFRCGGQTP